MPAPASATCGGVVDGVLYVIGGLYPYGAPALNTVWAYDPRTDSWSRKTDMPTARRFLSAAVLDGIIYVIGGSAGAFPAGIILNTVEAYDPTTDTWATNKAPMPTARGAMAVCALDGIIYAIGGSRDGSLQYATVEAYDPKTDRWTTKSSLPQAIHFLTASAANGRIYVFEGSNTYEYNPTTDHWTTKASFAPWSWGLMSCSLNGLIYLFGGMTRDMFGSYDSVQTYDPMRNQFSPWRKMPRTRLLSACGTIDGKVYLAGGVSKEPVVNPDAVYWKVLDVFDPQGGVTPQIIAATLQGTNSFRIVWEGEVGRKYLVESRVDVARGSWATVRTALATNELVATSCPIAAGVPKRFYRIREAP
jgi:N-acetylneuraminic acid mutarotase